MSEQAPSTGYSAGERWGQEAFPSSFFYCASPSQQPGLGSFRPRQPLPSRPRRDEHGRGGRTSASASGTLVHAREGPRLSPPGQLAHHHPAATTAKKPDRHARSELEAWPGLVEWTEWTEPPPPPTPQIRRLPTPELEPLPCGDGFCDCLWCGEALYGKGREKMDGQREYLTSWCRG